MVGYCRSFSLGWRDLSHATQRIRHPRESRGWRVVWAKKAATQGKKGKIDLFPVGGGIPWVADNTSSSATGKSIRLVSKTMSDYSISHLPSPQGRKQRATEATNGRLRLVAGRGAGSKKARGAFATHPPKPALSSGGASVARPKLRLEATLPRDPRWFRSTHWLSDSSSIPCTPTAARSHPTTHPLWSCLRLSSFPCRC